MPERSSTFFVTSTRTGQHHRRFRPDIGEGAEFLHAASPSLLTGFLVAEHANRAGAIDDSDELPGGAHN